MLRLILPLLFLLGCVSAHKENMAVQKGPLLDKDIKVSVELNTDLSTDNFKVLEFTLENTGEYYKRFKDVNLILNDKIKDQVKIVVGQDLVNWAEGIKNKMEIDNYNRQMIMAGVTGLAAVSGTLSKDPNFQKAAAGVTLAGAGMITLDYFNQVRNQLQDSAKSDTRGLIPENHILSAPLNVPPNLFLKRFAVFHTPTSVASEFRTLDLKLTGGDQKTPNLLVEGRFLEMSAFAQCQSSPGTMVFRGLKISCLQDCQRVHPLNQKNCEKSYKKKFL